MRCESEVASQLPAGLTCRVLGYSIEQSANAVPHAVYTVATCTADDQHFWQVRHRFSDFAYLRNSLKQWRHHSALPKLPGKTWFARSCLGTAFLQQRQKALDRFVQRLASSPTDSASLLRVPGVAKFLGIYREEE